jgi:HD-like signal output (HDOD) protein
MTAAVDNKMLRNLTPIGQMSPEAFTEIAENAKVKSVPAGTQLFQASQTDDQTIFLLDGTVELLEDGLGIETVASGSVTAQMPLAPQQPRRATAKAKTEVQVVQVPSSLLQMLIQPPCSGEYDVEEISGDDERIESKLLCDIFEDYVANKLDVPTLPDIALRVREAVDDDDANVPDVTRIVSSDPSIAGRLVQVANSPAYRGVSSAETCRDAIVRLGLTTTKELVNSIALKSLFNTSSSLLKARMQELWRHSTHIAAISNCVAKKTPGINPDRALLAGLVHDIGALSVIMRAAHYSELLSDAAQLDLAVAKLRGQVGAMILRKWEFPDDIVTTAIEVEDWNRNPDITADCCDVVMVAQLLSYVGTPKAKDSPPVLKLPATQKLAAGGLEPQECLGIIDEAAEAIQDLQKALAG